MNKKEKQQKAINVLKQIAITLTVLPLMFFVFTVDRIILIVLPHLHGRNFKNWLENSEAVIQTILRLVAVSTIYGLIELIKWTF
jgi:hypothetical protein